MQVAVLAVMKAVQTPVAVQAAADQADQTALTEHKVMLLVTVPVAVVLEIPLHLQEAVMGQPALLLLDINYALVQIYV
jgi:hypothetical protein